MNKSSNKTNQFICNIPTLVNCLLGLRSAETTTPSLLCNGHRCVSESASFGILVVSTNSDNSMLIPTSIQVMHLMKRIGSTTDPRGMLLVHWFSPKLCYLWQHAAEGPTASQPVSQFSIHLTSFPTIPWAFIFLMRCVCGAAPKAFWESRYTTLTFLVL